MPKPPKGMSKSEYIYGFCPAYIKKHEPSKSNWERDHLIAHCAGLWNKYKGHSNAVEEILANGYIPVSFSADCLSYFSSNKGIISLSDMTIKTITEHDETREYTVVDAIVAVGDRFYGNIYVPSEVLKFTAHLWESTYNDISHLGTLYPAGLSSVENIEYITGYNSDSFFDESVNGVRLKMHISHNAPKYNVWKSFINITKDAKKIPNVSIFGFSKFKTISKNKLPSGTVIPESLSNSNYFVVMAEIIPVAVTTCLKGKCDDSAGCGISTAFCESGKCQDLYEYIIASWRETDEYYRFRVRDPNSFKEGSFRMKSIDNGVRLVLGRLKNQVTLTTQALLFSKSVFKTLNNAKKWKKEHWDKKNK